MVSPRSRSSVASRAVRKITGMSTPSERIRRQTSKPSRSGSITSRTTRSGDVGPCLTTLERVAAPGCLLDLEATKTQRGDHDVPDVVFVLDDPHLGRTVHTKASGSLTCGFP